MEEDEPIWDSGDFRARVATLSHALLIMTVITVWLIYLQDVFQPLFIALAIYFVLKPGSEYLSKNGFPIFLSYLTMLLLAFLVVSAAGFFAYEQAQSVLDDEDKMDEFIAVTYEEYPTDICSWVLSRADKSFALWATPNRCCSSMIANPRESNWTRSSNNA